jgi:acyl dehydratase
VSTVAVPAFYFEEVAVGEVQESPGLTVTEAHVSLYRALAGDDHAVPDLLLLSLMTGLGWRIPRPPLVVLAFMGIDWKVLRPFRVGDTIHNRCRTTSKRSLREGGVVTDEHEIIDQHGEIVQHGRFTYLVAKRPKAQEGSP